MASAFSCTDVRDRVYGTLPLIDWESRTPIYPAYEKSRFELALEVIRHGWLCGGFATMERIVGLVSTFEFFEKDANSDQFEQTASVILARPQMTESVQTGDGKNGDMRLILRDRLQMVTAKEYTTLAGNLSSEFGTSEEQEDLLLAMRPQDSVEEDTLYYPLTSASSIDMSSISRSRALHLADDQPGTIILRVRPSGDDTLPITALHLGCRTNTPSCTTTPKPLDFYDIHLTVEDAVIIAFVTASAGNVSEAQINSFLGRLNSSSFQFSSCAKKQPWGEWIPSDGDEEEIPPPEPRPLPDGDGLMGLRHLYLG